MSGWKKIGGGGRNGRDPKHANRHVARTPIPARRAPLLVRCPNCKAQVPTVPCPECGFGEDDDE